MTAVYFGVATAFVIKMLILAYINQNISIQKKLNRNETRLTTC